METSEAEKGTWHEEPHKQHMNGLSMRATNVVEETIISNTVRHVLLFDCCASFYCHVLWRRGLTTSGVRQVDVGSGKQGALSHRLPAFVPPCEKCNHYQ
eukprot:3147818-Amphidinium_carterae.1